MITVSEKIIDGFYNEGIKHITASEITDLVNEAESRARLNGTSVSTVMYLDQINNNTLTNMVLNCIIARMTGETFRIDSYPTN